MSGRWQTGPEFLRLPKEQWPQSKPEANQKQTQKLKGSVGEQKEVGAVLATPSVIDAYSSWKKLVWVTAWVLRLMHLSMLSPRVGGGGTSDPGDFDIKGCHLGRDFDIHLMPVGRGFDMAAILED